MSTTAGREFLLVPMSYAQGRARCRVEVEGWARGRRAAGYSCWRSILRHLRSWTSVFTTSKSPLSVAARSLPSPLPFNQIVSPAVQSNRLPCRSIKSSHLPFNQIVAPSRTCATAKTKTRIRLFEPKEAPVPDRYYENFAPVPVKSSKAGTAPQKLHIITEHLLQICHLPPGGAASAQRPHA
jgi:hypothetical protein